MTSDHVARIRIELQVRVPAKGSPAWNEIYQNWEESVRQDQGDSEFERVKNELLDENDWDRYVQDALAYYIMEEAHVGNYTESVTWVHDSIEWEAEDGYPGYDRT